MRARMLFGVAVAVISLLGAACGESSPSTAASSPSASAAATGEKIAVTNNAKFGQILVDDKGMTVYLFVKDRATGDTTGQGVNGFGDLWWVLNPSGTAITTK